MLSEAKLQIKSAINHFVLAYIIVTILAYASSYLTGMILKLPPPVPGSSIFDSPEFVKSVPFHLLINLLTWTFFSYRYFRKNGSSNITTALKLGFLWLLMAMAVDLVFFVLIPSPVVLTIHQFYVEYQPWISITYGIVFVSPFLASGLKKGS